LIHLSRRIHLYHTILTNENVFFSIVAVDVATQR
jgi:hypothetical protein